MRRRSNLIAVLMVLLVTVAACGTRSTNVFDVSFYATPSPLPASAPGTVIRSESMTAPFPDTDAWRVMYVSTGITGEPIVVTGMVFAPSGPAPAGGRPVVTWSHPTTGIDDVCAPSRAPKPYADVQGLEQFLDLGWVVVATDYEGLGTIGRHPYLVGASEARSTLDIALAASRVPDWRTGRRVAVWGHSQGGHAALYTTTIADDYTEIDVEAVVAGAPPSGLEDFALRDEVTALRPFTILVALAFNSIDPDDAPLDAALSPTGVALAERSTQACSADLHAAVAELPPGAVLTRQPPTDEWLGVLRANDPLSIDTPSSVPTLIIHGTDDDLIPVGNSIRVHQKFCELGRRSELWVGEGTDHLTIVSATFPTMMRWISAHMADPAPPPVAPPPPVGRTVC